MLSYNPASESDRGGSEVKAYIINCMIMDSVFINLTSCTIFVPILHTYQDVIAEDAREGLPSSPSDPTMVTLLTVADVLTQILHLYIHNGVTELVQHYPPLSLMWDLFLCCMQKKCTPACLTCYAFCSLGSERPEEQKKHHFSCFLNVQILHLPS